MIRLIALDIDGTLLTTARTVGAGTREALHEARRRGCEVVLATGRAFGSLMDVMELTGCVSYAVTSNGAGIFRAGGEMLFSARFPRPLLETVAAVSRRFGVSPEVFIRGQAYCSGRQLDCMRDWGVPEKTCGYILRTRVRVDDYDGFLRERADEIEGMDMLAAPAAIRVPLRAALEEIDGVCVSSSSPYYMDICAAGVTKASGLARLCGLLGIGSAEVMAFGDAENDREMLAWAGVGVAMGNAAEELKAVADHVTDDNDSDGIPAALRRFGVI